MLLFVCACQTHTYYPPNIECTSEDILQTFFDNKEVFINVANILLENDDAYENRIPSDSAKLFLGSSTFEKYKTYYSNNDYNQLESFFQSFDRTQSNELITSLGLSFCVMILMKLMQLP